MTQDYAAGAAVPFDLNDDEVPDTVAVDTEGDAVADVVGFDIDEDSVPDAVAVDTDADATADVVAFDLGEDSAADVVIADTDGDGVADTELGVGGVTAGDGFDLQTDEVDDGVMTGDAGTADLPVEESLADDPLTNPPDDVTGADVTQAADDLDHANLMNQYMQSTGVI